VGLSITRLQTASPNGNICLSDKFNRTWVMEQCRSRRLGDPAQVRRGHRLDKRIAWLLQWSGGGASVYQSGGHGFPEIVLCF